MKIAGAQAVFPKITPLPAEAAPGPESRGRKSHTHASGRDAGPPVATDITPSADPIRLGQLEVAHADMRSVAQQIRAVDKTMQTIEAHLRHMQEALTDIVKIYPPYPKESRERIDALRQFSTLRKMIDQLTVPPPDDSPAKILGDEKRFSGAGAWEIRFGNEGEKLHIEHLPLHAEAGGLDLPQLPWDASDESLHQALEALPRAAQTARRRRQDFAVAANQVLAAAPCGMKSAERLP